THFGHRIEIVVEGPRRVGRSERGQPRPDVVHGRPVAWPAAHGDAFEDKCLALRGRGANAVRGDDGRRWQHQLETVLELTIGVENQDVLGTGADVDGQNLHRPAGRA